MKIIYRGRRTLRSNPLPDEQGDVIELLYNNWDDFGYETSFPTSCRINGLEVHLSTVKLLIEGAQTSSAYLQTLLGQGWDGEFPIPGANYISVASEIEFYEQLIGLIGMDGAIDVARTLRDASYLTQIEEDPAAQALIGSPGFQSSLQRERGAIKAFTDGWQLFTDQKIAVMDVEFRFETSSTPSRL